MYIYLIESDNGYECVYKIGLSKKVERRIKEIKTGNPEILTIVEKIKTEYPYKLEVALHNMFRIKRKEGEWYNLLNDDVMKFKDICEKFEKNFVFLEKNENPFFSTLFFIYHIT